MWSDWLYKTTVCVFGSNLPTSTRYNSAPGTGSGRETTMLTARGTEHVHQYTGLCNVFIVHLCQAMWPSSSLSCLWNGCMPYVSSVTVCHNPRPIKNAGEVSHILQVFNFEPLDMMAAYHERFTPLASKSFFFYSFAGKWSQIAQEKRLIFNGSSWTTAEPCYIRHCGWQHTLLEPTACFLVQLYM